jgi:hypothetical protein
LKRRRLLRLLASVVCGGARALSAPRRRRAPPGARGGAADLQVGRQLRRGQLRRGRHEQAQHLLVHLRGVRRARLGRRRAASSGRPTRAAPSGPRLRLSVDGAQQHVVEREAPHGIGRRDRARRRQLGQPLRQRGREWRPLRQRLVRHAPQRLRPRGARGHLTCERGKKAYLE